MNGWELPCCLKSIVLPCCLNMYLDSRAATAGTTKAGIHGSSGVVWWCAVECLWQTGNWQPSFTT